MIHAIPDKPWNWCELSTNSNITWEIVQENPDKPWNWNGLSRNPNITWEIVQENPDKPWNWSGLSRNPNITWNIVQENPNKPWRWDHLSANTFNLRKYEYIPNLDAVYKYWYPKEYEQYFKELKFLPLEP